MGGAKATPNRRPRAMYRAYMGPCSGCGSLPDGTGVTDRTQCIQRPHAPITRLSNGPYIQAQCQSQQRVSVIRIQTLGGLAVFDGTRPLAGNAQQPRRLAVLAVLARAGDRGVSRGRLAALLWEDVEEERARRSLNQALYALRHDLGSEEAVLGTRELRLNPELIETDLAAFDTARASGALEQAARLFPRPFLGDFHLPGVPAFAHWADHEREGIAADYRGLLESAATSASARGDQGAAVLWWRRLAALDPTDTRSAQGLMRALAASGDAPGALRHAEIVHQIRRAELELPPDPDVESLAERIRRGELAPRAEREERAEKAKKADGGPPERRESLPRAIERGGAEAA